MFRLITILSILAAQAGFAVTAGPGLAKAISESKDKPVTVLINLKGYYDLSKLRTDFPTQAERGKYVASVLEKYNKQAAGKALSFLNAKDARDVQEITPLWITNSIRVTAKPSVLQRLLTWSSVESIDIETPKQIGEMMDNVQGTPIKKFSRLVTEEVGWGIEKLGALELWAKGVKGKGVVVAMIDSGVNREHPDLKPNIWKNPGETGEDEEGNDKATNGIDDDENGYVDDVVGWNFEDKNNDPKDDNGHGTQTAGLVGGNGASGTKTGAAPEATLMVLRSCCNSGTEIFESNTWEALQYAVKNGAEVISMSMSAKHPSHPQYAKWRKASEAILAAGVIHVNSAGNMGGGSEPHNMGAPASNPPAWFFPEQSKGGVTSMITIGAVDKEDKPRYYSSAGPVTWEDIEPYKDYPFTRGEKKGMVKPEVCAPDGVPSTSSEGKGYSSDFAGTSAATPQAAGIVVLLKSAVRKATVAEMTEALQMTAKEVEGRFTNKCGAGRMDAVAALDYLKEHHKL